MKKSLKKINTCLSIYLTPEEGELLHKRMQGTTCRSKSEYTRKLLLGKPVRVLTRSESIDDLIEELVGLRRDLASLTAKTFFVEGEGARVLCKVNEIKEIINKLADHVCKSKL